MRGPSSKGNGRDREGRKGRGGEGRERKGLPRF